MKINKIRITKLWKVNLEKIRKLIAVIIRRQISRLWVYIGCTPNVEKSGKLFLGKGVIREKGEISVGKGSSLYIGTGSVIAGNIIIGENSNVEIQSWCVLRNVNLSIINNSQLRLEEGTKIEPQTTHPVKIILDNGILIIGEKSRIQAEINVRFGGQMRIGKYVVIGPNTEIRCDERIEIGDYALLSYDICIYDTNTHSTDWQKRREVIERMYHTGLGEQDKPCTRPIIIGSDVWIGKGATILKGAIISNRSIIGIRSIVGTGYFPEDSLIVAPKARIIERKS